MAIRLKFRIKVEEVLCYPGSENKGADQLRGYREADLRLCFRICKKPVFSRRGSIMMFRTFAALVSGSNVRENISSMRSQTNFRLIARK